MYEHANIRLLHISFSISHLIDPQVKQSSLLEFRKGSFCIEKKNRAKKLLDKSYNNSQKIVFKIVPNLFLPSTVGLGFWLPVKLLSISF